MSISTVERGEAASFAAYLMAKRAGVRRVKTRVISSEVGMKGSIRGPMEMGIASEEQCCVRYWTTLEKVAGW